MSFCHSGANIRHILPPEIGGRVHLLQNIVYADILRGMEIETLHKDIKDASSLMRHKK